MTAAEANAQTIATINGLVAPFVYLLLGLLTMAMGLRIVRHWRSGRKTPLLLARDFALFLALLVLIGGAQFARFTGTKLSEQLWWVVLTDVLSVAVLGLWLLIELAVIGRRKDEDES